MRRGQQAPAGSTSEGDAVHRYNPFNWYWKHADGLVFSSVARGPVHADDEAFRAWLADGNSPTPWPRDEHGAQTPEALDAVLEPFGLSTVTIAAASFSELRANAILVASRSCAEIIARRMSQGPIGAPILAAQFQMCAAIAILALSANAARSNADLAVAMTTFKEALDATVAEASAARPNS